MGFLSKFEGKMEDTFEGAADKMANAPLSPVQIAKKAEKQMKRNKMVGAGKQYAPTLYTVLVNEGDDARLFGYYPTLAGETESYLAAKAVEEGLVMDGQPLVRFIVDEGLRHGKFEVVAEPVAAPLIAQLRKEEMDRYGISTNEATPQSPYGQAPAYGSPYGQAPNYDDSPYGQAPAYDDYGQDDDYGEYDDYDDQANGDDAPHAGAHASYADDYDGGYEDQAEFDADAGAYNGYADFDNSAEPETMVFGQDSNQSQANPGGRAPLAVLYDDANDREYPITRRRVIIGRDTSCDIVINDPNISRQHAELRLDEIGAWVLTDLGSTNGTTVNDIAQTRYVLRPGDIIGLGKTELALETD